MVAPTKFTLIGTPICAVRLRTRASGGAEPAHTVAAVKPLGGTSVVQMSRWMVSRPKASRLDTLEEGCVGRGRGGGTCL